MPRMWETVLSDTHHIMPSLTVEKEYYLFCPNGEEIHFKLRDNGVIVPLNRTVIWRAERESIKGYFGL